MTIGPDLSRTILLFTDGACSGNPGPGGYGSIVVTPQGQVDELGGNDPSTTNNRMEMMAVLKGLQRLKNVPGDLWVLTDSTYLIRGITQWIWGWKKRGWTTSNGAQVNNRELWELLEQEVRSRKDKGRIEWKYVRGHKGTPGNERCDEIAVSYSKNQKPRLFRGSLLQYPIPIHDLPEDMSLPPLKSNEEKPRAFSYLSYVNGVLARHSSWAECEAKVKGKSGAKFKKALSSEDEVNILRQWGLHPNLLDSLDENPQ